MHYARLAMLLTLALFLVSCGGGGAASSGGGSAVPGPGGTTMVPGKTGVTLDISVKRTASKDVRLATNEDVQEVLIDFLDPTTLRQVVNTTIIRRTAPTVDVTIEVPVGTWIMRCQGRTLTGEVAGTRYETTITVVEGQTTEATAELNPAVILAGLQVTPGPTALAAQGTTLQFTATGILSDLTTAPVAVAWTSSNPAVANINAAGLTTALSAGTTSIQARSGNIVGSATLTVTPTALKSLQVTPNPVELSPGLTQQLTATGIFEDNTNQNVTGQVTWSSSASGVASVNASGLVTGGTPGNATITATLGNTTATTSVRVKPQLRSITLSPANVSLPVGLTQTVRATGVFSDNTTEDISEAVTWTSADNTTATVTNTGLVTAAKAGSTTVTATFGNISATAPVTVLPLQLTRLAIAPPSATVPKGGVQAFNATGVFNNNTTRDVTEEVTWTSTNTSVLAISNANGTRGQASAVNAGSSVVEATLDGISAAATVNVTPATLTSISLSPAQPEVVSGDLVVFSATGTYSDGTTLDITNEVTWTSGNVSVVVVSNADGSRGHATSIATGETTVTATLGNVTASTRFTTKAPIIPPPVPTPTPTPATITAQLVSYINGDPTVASGSAEFGFRGQAVSADGRYVAFIGPGTVDGLGDRGVFRRDTTTGAVVRCSLTTTGALPTVPAGKQYFTVSISDDGSKVCFSTNQQLAPNDLGNSNTIQDYDVYLRDLSGAGTTTLVSLDNAGLSARGYSVGPALSGNGSVVAFQWGPGPFTPLFFNVLVADPVGSIPTPLTATDSLPAGQQLIAPQLNFDGSVVALGSNLDLGNEAFSTALTGQFMVFRHAEGVFTRISRQPGDVAPNPPAPLRSANYPDVSADGNTIAFEADYDLLVTRGSPEAHTNSQIYRWTNPSTITRVSESLAGTFADPATDAGLSGNGRYVTYLSREYQVADTPAPNWGLLSREAWARDTSSGIIGRLTYTGIPGGGNANGVCLTSNGAGVVITTDATAGLRAPSFTPPFGQLGNVLLMPNLVLNGATPPDKPTTPLNLAP